MKTENQFLLLKSIRFLPLFVTQFLGAFHDNVFKNAFVVMLLFDPATHIEDPKLYTTLAGGIFILPFVLFSALSGQFADKYSKEHLTRAIKIIEIGIAVLGAVALLNHSVLLSFLTLFALGTHSAFFSPAKYAMLPDHLKPQELIGGNALINTGTFLAILLGTITGTLLITLEQGEMIISAVLIASALSGYCSARWIPVNPARAPQNTLNLNPLSETFAVLKYVFSLNQRIIRCIMGIAWFWFLGMMFMAQLPNYTHEVLRADEHVLSFFLVLFSVGIAGGGLINNRLLKGRIEGLYVPLAMLGITLFSFDLYIAGSSATPVFALQGLTGFLSQPHNWRIIADILMIAVCGGLFVVPLNAIVQHLAPEDRRARILAGSAILDAVMMVMSSIISALLFKLGFSITQLFLAFALANLFVAVYICFILPDFLFKSLLQVLFKFLYKVEVRGLENVEKAGPRAVIVGNHVSLLDPPLLAAFLPGKPMFAINKFVAEWWWVRPFLRLVDNFPLDPASPFSLKRLMHKVQEDRHVVIFPEGRLTDTGALMKVYDGPGMIADKTDAMILPVRLDGVQHTPFARLKGKVPLKNFPKITITILEPRKFTLDPALKGRARRAAASQKLYTLMEEMMFLTGDREQTLFQALLKARHVNGDHAIIIEDIAHKPMKFKTLVSSSLLLGGVLADITTQAENVGLLVPNSTGAIVSFFALQAFGRVPAMLNYSSGPQSISSACKTASIKTVLTSRRFIETGRLEPLIETLSAHVKIVYLEDLKKQITSVQVLRARLSSPARLHKRLNIRPSDPAVVLFTSGSEGMPKGVVLSHINIMSNIVQLSSRADFNQQDHVFNCLPIFHSFGLTAGTLLPILSGIRTFLYPSPLHYRIIPEMVYNTNATILFGTDTFLQGYARKANPYDFYRMRYIFAGAEKVRDETRTLYREKFSVQILEGYGATETAPVIAVNSAMHRKDGTVGRFLSGLETKLEPVEGIPDGGRLFVRGPNVMLGYYMPDNPGVLIPPEGGWHDTGDIVSVDAEGYVKILGRAKRFAKIAGEMVSLGQVETMAQAMWPDSQHAVISQPDARKGEQLLLFTTDKNATREALSRYAAETGFSPLSIPAQIIILDKIPLLGTGKTDYNALKASVDKPAPL